MTKDDFLLRAEELLHFLTGVEREAITKQLGKFYDENFQTEKGIQEYIIATLIANFSQAAFDIADVTPINGVISKVEEKYFYVYSEKLNKTYKLRKEDSILDSVLKVNDQIRALAILDVAIYQPIKIEIKKTKEPKQSGNPVA